LGQQLLDTIYLFNKIKLMAKKIKKNITLDDLAGMVSRGFDGVGERFDEVETGLKNLGNGVEEIKLKLD